MVATATALAIHSYQGIRCKTAPLLLATPFPHAYPMQSRILRCASKGRSGSMVSRFSLIDAEPESLI
jgi:hypothetical protein